MNRHQTNCTLALLIGALLAVSAPPQGRTQPQVPGGTWTGAVTQPESQHTPYPVWMILTPGAPGAACGSILYPTLQCGGTVVCPAEGDGPIALTERITYGRERCVDRGSIRIEPQPANALDWTWYDTEGRKRAWATLSPATGQPPWPLTPVRVLEGTATNATVNKTDGLVIALATLDGEHFRAIAHFADKNLYGRTDAPGARTPCAAASPETTDCFAFIGQLTLGDDGSGFPSGTTAGLEIALQLTADGATGSYRIAASPPLLPVPQEGVLDLPKALSDADAAVQWTQSLNPAGESATLPRPGQVLTDDQKRRVAELLEQAAASYDAKDWDKTIALCTEAIALDQGSASAFQLRANANNEQGKYELAIADGERLVQLLPGSSAAYNTLGWNLLLHQDLDKAKEALLKAYEILPGLAGLVNIGHIYLLTGDPVTARKYYEHMLCYVESQDDLKKGPIADFELFIAKGWQPDLSRQELEWLDKAKTASRTCNYPGHAKEVRGKYKNGARQGPWKEWYDDGGSGEGNYAKGQRTGTWIVRDDKGRKSSAGTFKAGQKDGLWKEWFDDGGWVETTYVAGKAGDRLTYRSSNGAKVAEGQLQDGRKTGAWREWYKDGGKGEGSYVNGKKEGSWKEWYAKGKPSVEGTFKDGQRNGPWKEWDKDGGRIEGHYLDGTADGHWTAWYANGKKRAEGELKGGEKDGPWKEWEKDGTWGEVGYLNGKLHGASTFWFANGKKKSQGAFSDGELDGPWTYWLSDGQKSHEGTFKSGKKDGFWKERYDDGRRGEGAYLDGKEDGQWTIWYANGKKLAEGTFKGGKRDGPWKEWEKDGTWSEGGYLNP